MDEKYFAQKIEDKWQTKWRETGAFEADVDDTKPKFYALEMLPYPSGNLHMGHVRNYSIGDALAWYKRLKGFNVLHPIGWDSFGQPAEDAAIKRGANPRDWTEANIQHMTGQLQRLGLSYDWSRQMAAHRPDYYKFDQWFFIKMYEMGLAYKKKTQVNWCETDKAVLSNEQASGGLCWRCGNPVTKRDLEQWFLKTTNYADQLLDDMAEIETGWAEKVLKRQRDWIGRSEGAFVDFEVQSPKSKVRSSDSSDRIKVFTTRIDTIYGANAIVVAAEHPIVEANYEHFSDETKVIIENIKADKLKVTDHDAEIEKEGVDTGLEAVNPFSGEELPIWVGNYVMIEYGTGAVMSVPAHDERDFEFARKYHLPIRQVISEPHLAHEHHQMQTMSLEQAFTDYGVLVHSDNWNGKTSDDAKKAMTEYAVKHGFGEGATTYRLRDWGISRQRFWGAPIPVVYCEKCGIVPEKYENLPIELPQNMVLSDDIAGTSPLAKDENFVNTVCPNCGEPAKRETDTMDTFVDSCWYYFRYTDPQNGDLPFDPKVAEYWTPVDQYIGGDDHAVMHLIYTRFWTKVMRDIGLVKFNEPVKRLLTQGMVVGETFFDMIPNPEEPESAGKRQYFPPSSVTVERDAKGKIISAKSADGIVLKSAIERMSKSKGNGVDPDEMVEIYGADASRLFVLFAAPAENELVWNESGIEGTTRFLQRVWRFVHKWQAKLSEPSAVVDGLNSTNSNANENPPATTGGSDSRKLRQKTHQSIKRVTENFESLQFNTPVAALMELSNALYDFKGEPETASDADVFAIREAVESLILMLAPFAPHAAEELYSVLVGNENGMLANRARFPEFSAELAKSDEIEIPVQINGKLRSRLIASPEASNDELQKMALEDEKVREWTNGKEIVKVVVVPKRLVNIVVKG
ncbi:MAG: leucine--tRNA ligase [Pyrinomonadaceae bacterium]|nr:leucine--tRNA ligase [Pyrinomonadaceae bacterium]